MTALSTHDTKRVEDVRARLAVLAEIPAEWAAAVDRWSARGAAAGRRARPPALADRGRGLADRPPSGCTATCDKAAREARTADQLGRPGRGVRGGDARGRRRPRWSRARCATTWPRSPTGSPRRAGRTRSAQKLVQLTMPGVPDTYQGSELWDLSLVDPDNRRPVDFALRDRLLAAAGRGLAAGLGRRRRARPSCWSCPGRCGCGGTGRACSPAYAPVAATGPAADARGRVRPGRRGDGRHPAAAPAGAGRRLAGHHLAGCPAPTRSPAGRTGRDPAGRPAGRLPGRAAGAVTDARSIPDGLVLELSRGTVLPGASAEADRWMAMLNDRLDECVATLDRERMAVEIVFRLREDGPTTSTGSRSRAPPAAGSTWRTRSTGTTRRRPGGPRSRAGSRPSRRCCCCPTRSAGPCWPGRCGTGTGCRTR